MDESKDFMSHARFTTVSKTFKQMMETPRVNVMIMTRESFATLKKCLKAMETKNPMISGITVYFHQWLGDLIVYGNSENSVIKKIIDSCETRKDDCPQQGLKMKEVIQ